MLITNSRSILLSHVDRLKRVVTLKNKNDKQNAQFFEAELSKLAKKHLVLSRLRILVFALIYASVVSAFVSGLPVLGDVAQTITLVGGIFGVGFLGLVALWITWRRNQFWDRMILLYGHIVAIYEKNNKGLYHLEDLPPEKTEKDVE